MRNIRLSLSNYLEWKDQMKIFDKINIRVFKGRGKAIQEIFSGVAESPRTQLVTSGGDDLYS